MAALCAAVAVASGVVFTACQEIKDLSGLSGLSDGNKKSTEVKNVTFAFNQPASEVRGGQSVTLQAVVRDPDSNPVTATVTTYSIAPADQVYATINATTGVLTAATVLQEASHTVTVTASTVTPDGFGHADPITTQIAVRSRVNSIALATQPVTTPAAITMRVGDPASTLVATATIVNGSPTSPAVTYNYTSSNSSQVAVDAQGKVTAIAPTTTAVTITASAEGSSSNTVSVTILPALVTTVVVNPPTITVRAGDFASLTVAVSNPPAGTGTITWDSPDKTRVTVDASGKVTGVAVTLANTPVRVTATYKNGATTVVGFSDITVLPLAPVVTITPRPASVQAGQTVQLTANVANPVGATAVTWTTSDNTRADVNATGLVSGKIATAVGQTVRITARYVADNVTYSDFVDVAVTAAVNPPTIAFSPTNSTVAVAGTAQVTATVSNPVVGGVLSVAPADPTIALFSQSTNNGTVASGSIVGRAAGSTQLVATYTAGSTVVTNSSTITVTAPASRVAKIVLEPRDEEVTAPVGFAFKVRYLDASGNETTPETAAEGGLTRFFNGNDAVATLAQSTTDPSTATVTSKTAGSDGVTVIYQRNGQNIATDNTNVTVYAAGSVGHYGSLTISTAGDARKVAVGQSLLFQVMVRNQSNVVLTTGVTGLTVTASDGVTTRTLTRTNDPTGYFYTVQGTSAGALLIKADIMGAATTIPLVITP